MHTPRVVIVILLGCLLAACGDEVIPSIGPAGLPRDEAVAKAIAGDANVVAVLDAKSGRLGEFVDAGTLPSENRDRPVWAITLSGQFGFECVAGAPCPPAASTRLVILDYRTGEFVMAQSPA